MRKLPLWKAYRALIVNSDATRTSVLQSVVSGKVSPLQERTPLSVRRDYKLDKTVFNLIECSPVCPSLALTQADGHCSFGFYADIQLNNHGTASNQTYQTLTRNTLDCDQSNYSTTTTCIVFSYNYFCCIWPKWK